MSFRSFFPGFRTCYLYKKIKNIIFRLVIISLLEIGRTDSMNQPQPRPTPPHMSFMFVFRCQLPVYFTVLMSCRKVAKKVLLVRMTALYQITWKWRANSGKLVSNFNSSMLKVDFHMRVRKGRVPRFLVAPKMLTNITQATTQSVQLLNDGRMSEWWYTSSWWW